MFSVQVDQASIAELNNVLAGINNGVPRALSSSINKTIKTTQVQAVKLIGQDLNLTAARIREDFVQEKSSWSKLSGALLASGDPVGLINFGARQTNKGVGVKVKKSSPRTTITHAYIAARGSKSHVYMRNRNNMPAAKKFPVGKKSKVPWPSMGGGQYSTGVERKTGPRIEDIYGSEPVYSQVQTIAAETYVKNLENETDSLLRRFG